MLLVRVWNTFLLEFRTLIEQPHTLGVVVTSGAGNDVLLNKRVFVLPMRGWKEDPDAPEDLLGWLLNEMAQKLMVI